jgi:hypothetical protein
MLKRLLQLRRDHADEMNEDGHMLLDRAIFSRVLAAARAGVGGEAQVLLDESRTRSRVPAELRRASADRGLGSVVIEGVSR